MDLQICAGKFKGKKLRIPDSMTDFRPTKQIVREAICSSIQISIAGSTVLEVCSGSGVFSLELLSRGADHCTALEISPDRAALLKKFASELNLADRLTVSVGDALSLVPKLNTTYDIIFFDPPYYEDSLSDLTAHLCTLLTDGGILIFEYASDDKYASNLALPENMHDRIRKYGQSSLRYFYKEQ